MISGYVFVAVNEIKNEIEATKMVKAITGQELSNLENETRVFKATLDNYLLYSQMTDRHIFLEEAIKDKRIEKHRDHYNINENIELNKLRVNSCNAFRCIQNRRIIKIFLLQYGRVF